MGFETTAELEPLRESIGQKEALEAVKFGLALDNRAYNIFAVGYPGSGRATMIRQLIQERAATEPTPSDWCYVYNFDSPREPNALELPPGRAIELREAIDVLLDELRAALPRALRSAEFRKQQEDILEQSLKEQRRQAEAFKQKVESEEFVTLLETPAGLIIAPARRHEPITDEHLQSLPEEQQRVISERRRELEKEFSEIQQRMTEPQRRAHRRIRDLQREVAQRVVRGRINDLKEAWEGVPEVPGHLDRMGEELIKRADQFTRTDDDGEPRLAAFLAEGEDAFTRFRVNVLVSNNAEDGAPLVEESNPTHHNLLGRLEHRLQFGTMVADFTAISAGALHRANGGYLLLEASDVLRQPFAWMAFKKSLDTGAIRLEEVTEYTSPVASTTLRPEPIPLRCKVILIGDPFIYQMLHAVDEDFNKLFKVKADFSPYIERRANVEGAYARFIARRCAEESLPPFSASAAARVIEHGSRLAQHQDRLTTRFEHIADLIREAAFFSRSGGQDVVTDQHVILAIKEAEQRVNRPEREMLKLIEGDVLAVEPTGKAVGQIYGLAVLSAGDHVFARPIKLEASVFMGTSGVVDIEREVRLGGPLHNKGVLVLSGYLGDSFAQEHPLIMSATLSFDQMYDEVEGDSASAAELYTLVSAIADVPIRQGIAVTGALNQKGEIQPIGAVTTKIEGFFRACERKGLTGEQGVIIPARNISNLTLNDEVIAAVSENRFHIWPIRRIEEGWEILTGLRGGERDASRRFPAESVYGRAAARLQEWASGWREFGSPVREGRSSEMTPGTEDAPAEKKE